MTDWRKRNLEAWRAMPAELRTKAVRVVDLVLTESTKAALRDEADRDAWWWAGYHAFAGLLIRNALRDAGLTDSMLPFHRKLAWGPPAQNWDDYYVAVMEVALRAGLWHELTEEERAEIEGFPSPRPSPGGRGSREAAGEGGGGAAP